MVALACDDVVVAQLARAKLGRQREFDGAKGW